MLANKRANQKLAEQAAEAAAADAEDLDTDEAADAITD